MVRISVGDEVTIAPRQYSRTGSAWFETVRVPESMNQNNLLVTRVYEDSVLVRGRFTGYDRDLTIQVGRGSILSVNGSNTEAAATHRSPGTKPEDTDEITYIGIDHPGIQWLWEDMADYARGKRWCDEYETLAAYLGIPGRQEDWDVHVYRGGVRISATIRARSEAQATAELGRLLAAE